LGLIQVSALFHLAQRPVFLRKVNGTQRAYVMATREDYDNTVAVWREIRETTETSAASHHLRFFHEVVEPLAQDLQRFTVKDLTDAWNAKFQDRKGSDTIRKWVDFLCEIDYMSKTPNPADKRENLLEMVQEKSGNYGLLSESVFFKLESFKAWLNETESILEENRILLRENLFDDAETTAETIYERYFSDENQNSSNNVLSLSEGALAESEQEKTESDKSPQYLDFPKPSSTGPLSTGELLELLRSELPTPFLAADWVDYSARHGWARKEAEDLLESLKGKDILMTPEGAWSWA
jgi:hypothetical protein